MSSSLTGTTQTKQGAVAQAGTRRTVQDREVVGSSPTRATLINWPPSPSRQRHSAQNGDRSGFDSQGGHELRQGEQADSRRPQRSRKAPRCDNPCGFDPHLSR